MHGVIHYALWCARNLRPSDDILARGDPFWNEVPEVEIILDWHLDPANDPSPAIRSVYGQFLPQLVLVGPDWTAENLERILPVDPEQRPLRAAAWGTYLMFSRLYRNTFELLRGEYERAVEDLTDAAEGHATYGEPEARLAEHLAILHWWGTLTLDDPLLERFFGNASPETRGTEDDAAAGAEELEAFGWWFESGKLNDEWCLARLLEVLEITGGKADFDRRVAEQLVVMASDHPVQVVECFRMMVEGDDEGWRVMAWRQQLGDVLRAALDSESDEARDRAERLINTLGELGHHEYRELLDG